MRVLSLTRTICLLYVPQDGGTPLHIAALKGHDDCCLILTDLGVDVNIKGQVGVLEKCPALMQK